MKCAVYVRVSTEEQAKEGYSLAAQTDKIVDYIKSKGWTHSQIYNDDGYSAASRRRPALERMLADAATRQFEAVLVYRIDRLSRNLKDLIEIVEELAKNGAGFKSITELIDTTTPEGRLMFHQFGSFAQYERELIMQHTTMGIHKRLKSGLWPGGYALQAWLFARDSSSISNLLFNLRYEGHPPLWHLLLYFITRFTTQPIFMQLLHLLIATLSIWIFLKFSPFSKLQKILFTFGYFPFWEYAIKSRNYALGILFLFIFCALLGKPTRKYTLLFTLLFLASQSNFMGAIIAITIGLFLLWEILFTNWRTLQVAKKWDITIGIFLFIGTVTLLIFQAHLPPDTFHEWASGYFTKIDFRRTALALCIINKAYVPLGLYKNTVQTYLLFSGIELFFVFLIFLRKPRILFLYFWGTFALLTFFYIKYEGIRIWHTGHLYILLILCLWIADYFRPRQLKSKLLNIIVVFAERYRNVFIILILSNHLICGLGVNIRDWKYPYSAAKETAQFIKKNHMETMLMLGDHDYNVSPIAGYLNNKIWYPRISGFGSYCLWNKKRVERKIDSDLVIQEAERLMSQYQTSILLILNYELRSKKIPAQLKMLGHFTNNFDKYDKCEVYYLYLLPYQKNPHTKS